MQRLVKKEVLSQASAADKIDIGFLTEKAVKDSVGVSEKQVLEFRLQCNTILIELLKKLLTK